MDVVRFALLGLGAGSVYALMALGLVLVYRGSGVLNFAQGAMGMIGAFTFYVWRDDGMPTVLAFALSVALGIAIGVATHFLIMRPLRRAPAISRSIATLACSPSCCARSELWGDTPASSRTSSRSAPSRCSRRRPRRRPPDPVRGRGRADHRAHVPVAAHPLRDGDERGGREPACARDAGHLARHRRWRELGLGAASPSSPRSSS